MWVPAVALVVLTFAALSSYGLRHGHLSLFATLYVCACTVALAAGLGLYLRWRMSGEAPLGYLAAALMTMSLSQLPLALGGQAFTADMLTALAPVTRLAAALPTGWLLWRCLRAPEVDSALRPLRLSLLFGTAAGLAGVLGVFAQRTQLIGTLTPAQANLADGILATGALLGAVGFWTRARSLRAPVTTRTAVALLGIGLSCLLLVTARSGAPVVLVAAGVLALMSVLLMALLAVSLLRSVIDFNGLAILSLGMRAESAEQAVRQEQERRHELRATVAGIRQASGTLDRHASALEPQYRRNLEQMMVAELARLERLLVDTEETDLGPVMLVDVIRPLVVGQREQGVNVHWQPSQACALARGDEVAEVLHVLLTNARRHAPGAPVEVMVETSAEHVRVHVRDHGPGVSAELASRLFERGVKSSTSPGQGLGLHIAKRLADRQGGTLTHASGPGERGTEFVLTLRAIADATAAVPQQTVPQQRTATQEG